MCRLPRVFLLPSCFPPAARSLPAPDSLPNSRSRMSQGEGSLGPKESSGRYSHEGPTQVVGCAAPVHGVVQDAERERGHSRLLEDPEVITCGPGRAAGSHPNHTTTDGGAQGRRGQAGAGLQHSELGHPRGRPPCPQAWHLRGRCPALCFPSGPGGVPPLPFLHRLPPPPEGDPSLLRHLSRPACHSLFCLPLLSPHPVYSLSKFLP